MLERKLGSGSAETQPFAERLKPKHQVFLFEGPEGSGKTTQADLFAAAEDFKRIGIGTTIRSLAKDTSTGIGRACKKLEEEHKYASPNLYWRVFDSLFEDKSEGAQNIQQRYVMDGTFRIPWHVKGFNERLKRNIGDVDVIVILLEVTRGESRKRLLLRNRDADDSPEGIEKRLDLYYKNIKQREALIEKSFNVIRVSVENRGIEEVHEEIMQRVKEVKQSWER